MDFHHLLQERDTLLRQSHLANVAYAYQRLSEFGARIAAARLRGAVRLQLGDPAGGSPWLALMALEGSPAVLEEHFTDEDAIELLGLLEFAGAEPQDGAFVFRLEQLCERYAPGLASELARAGVRVPAGAAIRQPSRYRQDPQTDDRRQTTDI